MTFDESAMVNQKGGDTSHVGKDQGANQEVEFVTQILDRMVISEEQHVGDD